MTQMNGKQAYLVVFYLLLATVSFYFSGIVGIISLFISLVLYSGIFYLLYYIWKNIRKKAYLIYLDFLEYFLTRVSYFILLIVAIIGSFAYYQNEVSPATMPRYTISNGEKTVDFQAMIHIGKESFYKQIQSDLYNAKKEGYVYFFEGVKPGSEENMKKFDDALGIEFTPDLYENFGKLYGVTFQDNSEYLGLVNNLDFNVDLSIDDIIENYDEKDKTGVEIPAEVQDINSVIIQKLAELNERELRVLVYINQAILNALMKSDSLQGSILENFGNKALFDVILGKRNDVVSEAIISSEYNKIYITYGLLHFEGVLKNLQKNDPRWKIVQTRYLYPISDGNK